MNREMTESRHLSSLGTFYAVLSAFGCTGFNICLRFVSNREDPAWSNCVQASVGPVVFGAYLAWLAARGHRALPPWKELAVLSLLGLITQIGGVLTIWAMGVVGVGITITLQTGGMLASSAVLGLIVLGEPVSWRQVFAVIMITGSVVFFSTGAQSASTITANGVSPLRVLLGIAAGVAGGLSFGILTVGIRKTVTTNTSPAAIVFLITLMGVVAFGPLSVYRLGLPALVHTPPGHLGAMLAAGAMNLLGFLLVTKSLQLSTVVRVNVINNGLTMALTVLAGIVMFGESCNRDILIGILFSAAGTLLISLVSSTEDESDSASKAAINEREILANENPTSGSGSLLP